MKASPASTVWRGLWVFTLVLILYVPETIQAQDVGFFFTGKKKSITIPFEWHSNLIIIPVRINESDTLNFILDTGISMNLLTDPTVAQKLNLTYVRTVNIFGVGHGEALTAKVSIGNRIYLPGVASYGQNVVALSEDMLHLSSYVGMPVHGIFGFELFRHFVIRIDFADKTISLYDPGRYQYRGKGEKVPIIIEDTKPYVYASAVCAGTGEVPIKVILDTGAGHALSLDLGTHEKIQLPDKIIRAQLGRGLNGIINGSLGRIEKIKIGSYELDHVITSFPDTTSLTMQLARNLQRQGNIGCELLKRFTVIFDYAHGYVILKPNRRLFKESFERDMSGLEIRAEGTNFKKFVVEYIYPGSPAELAGLQRGDELIAINNEMSSHFQLSDIIKVLQKGEGRTVKLFVRRQNSFFYTEFKLRRMI